MNTATLNIASHNHEKTVAAANNGSHSRGLPSNSLRSAVKSDIPGIVVSYVSKLCWMMVLLMLLPVYAFAGQATVNMQFVPTSAVVAQVVTARFLITDEPGDPGKSGMSFTYTLPSGGLTIVGTPASPQCGGIVTTSGNTITVTNAILATGAGTCTIDVPVNSLVAGTYNSTPANFGSMTSNLSNNANGSLVVSGGATLSAQVTQYGWMAYVGGTSYLPGVSLGGPATFTLTITNSSGNPALQNIGFVTDLMTGATFGTLSNTCGGNLSLVGNQLTLSGASLASGQASCSVTVPVTTTALPTPHAVPVGFENYGYYGGIQNTTGAPTNYYGFINAITGLQRGTGANMVFVPARLYKSASATAGPVGGQVNYILTVKNPDPTGATAVNYLGFVDKFPTNLTLLGPPVSTCGGDSPTITGNTLTWSNGSMAAGAQQCTITVTAILPNAAVGTQYCNYAMGNTNNGTTGGVNNVTGFFGDSSSGACVAIDGIKVYKYVNGPAGNVYYPGTTFEYGFVFTNLATKPLTPISFTDALPTGLTVGTPYSTDCGGNTFTVSGNTVSYSGNIPAGAEQCIVKIPVTIPADAAAVGKTYCNWDGGSGTATATQGYLFTTPYTHTYFGQNRCTGTVVPPALTKGVSSDYTVAGGAFNYTWTLGGNAALAGLSGLGFVDALPTSLIQDGAPTTTCLGATLSVTAANVLTVVNATLPASGSCTVTMPLRLPANAVSDTKYCNQRQLNSNSITATTGTITGLTGFDNNIYSNVCTTVDGYTLDKAKGVRRATVLVPANYPYFETNIGKEFDYVITINNITGNPAGGNFGFTDDLPTGVSVTGTPTSTCGSSYSAVISTVAGGDVLTFSGGTFPLTGLATCEVVVPVTARVTTTSLEPAMCNRVLTPSKVSTFWGYAVAGAQMRKDSTSFEHACVRILGPAVTKSVSSALVTPGQTFDYIITYTNVNNGGANPYPAFGPFGFVDDMPTDLTLGTPTTDCGSGTVSVGGSRVTLANASLSAGQASCQVVIPVTVPGSAVNGTRYNNGVGWTQSATNGRLAFTTYEPLSYPNVFTTVTSGSPLTKTFSPSIIMQSTPSVMTFTITNAPGYPAQSGMGFTETLPSGLTLSGTPVSPQCGGVVTYSADKTQLIFSGGTMTSGTTSCAISANVIASATGVYNNTPSNVTGVSPSLINNASATLTKAANNLSVSKVVSSAPTPTGTANQYSITYRMDVTNADVGAATYSLADTPRFGAGVTINSASCKSSLLSGTGTPNVSVCSLAGSAVSGLTNNTAKTLAAAGTPIDGAPVTGGVTTHRYELTVVYTVTPASVVASSSGTGCDVTKPLPSQSVGLNNAARMIPNGSATLYADDNACAPLPAAISVIKSVASAPVAVGAPGSNQYSVTYRLDVTNQGGSAGSYGLTDTPRFGVGATINSASCTSSVVAGTGTAGDCSGLTMLTNNTAGTVVPVGTPIDAGLTTHRYTITVVFTLDPTAAMTSSTSGSGCDTSTPAATSNVGLNNAGTVTPATNNGAVATSNKCTPFPAVIKLTKTAAVPSPGSHQIVYTITAQNVGGSTGTYQLVDQPQFGTGINLSSATCQGSGVITTACGGTTTTLTGVGPWALAPAGTSIAAGTTQRFTLTGNFTIVPTVTTTSADCTINGSETTNTGLMNLATLTPSLNGSTVTANACQPVVYAKITVKKKTVGYTGTVVPYISQFTGSNGLPTTATGIPTPTAGLATTVAALTNVPVALMATDTVITEESLASANYKLTDATCTGLISGNTATLVGQTLTIPASSIRDRAVIECTFTNTKLPTVTVKKVTQGYVGTSSFTGTNGLPATPTNIVTTAMNTAATTATPGAGLNALVLPIVPATDTVITEALPGAGYALTAISCSGLGAGGTANNNLTAGTVTLNPAAISAGSDVVCTFTNAKLPTLTISKISTGGVDTFGFTGNNGWLSQNITTLTQGVAATGSTQTLSAASTPTTITETMPAGYALNSVTCSGLNGGNVTLNLAAGTATLDALATAPGNVLTCTFNNGKMPALSFSKTVDVVFDPVNLGVNPKNIPGAVVEYTLGLVNSGSGMIDSNSTVITDKVPANTVLYVGNDPVWLAPFQFVDGTVASGLTCGFASLSDASDCMDFSNDNGGTFAYVPSPAADGFDSNVTNIRFKPAGSMNANSGSGSPSFKLKFKVKIK